MKIRMCKGEEYPYFGIGNDDRLPEIEVPDEMVARWNEVEKQCGKCQNEMAHFYYLSYPDIYTQYEGDLLKND